MGVVTVTRKIKLNINEVDSTLIKAAYKQLYDWNEIVFRAANKASSHQFFQQNIAEFFYLNEQARILFMDSTKPVDTLSDDLQQKIVDGSAVRVLDGTTQRNTTYQVLSHNYKGKIPSDILTNLNNQLVQTFNKEKKEYFSGARSLRSYRRNMPIPFSASNIRNISQVPESKDYAFSLFGISFKTYFGRDMSGNRIMWQRSLEGISVEDGGYKLCNSSIQLDGKHIFLLAVFQFQSGRYDVKEDKVMFAELSSQFPIVLFCGETKLIVGDKAEYLHRRYAIQGALRRQQIAARYNNGGKGRGKKMANIDRFTDYESDYISTRQHQYTAKVIDLCLKNRCGVLHLRYTPEVPTPDQLSRQERKKWEEENQLLLRNWGYHGLTEKFKYKCNKVGITLIVDKGIIQEEKKVG